MSKIKVNGQWEDIVASKVKIKGQWETVQSSWLKVDSVWQTISIGGPEIPTGLIIPYSGGAGGAPTGWSIYNTADGKHIIGAGDTYAVNDNGVGNGQVTKTSVGSGNHGGSSNTFTSRNNNAGNANAGNHSHTMSYTYVTPYQECYLIKAGAGLNSLPQNGVMFSQAALGGLTNIWTNGYIFKANNNVGTGGTNSITGRSTNTAGNHNHGTASGRSDAGKVSRYTGNNAGGHSHSSITATITNNLNKYLLSAWQNAAADFNLASSMIGMYESVTPPTGWSLCDGNGGTPDLRNHFIKPITSESEDSSEGNGTLSMTTGALTHGNHEHSGGFSLSPAGETARHATNASHPNHGGSSWVGATAYTWLPPYYALAFIKKD